MAGRLQGKIAVVTGASSGLGRAVAVRYAQEGARVICADIQSTARAGIATEATQTTHDLLNQENPNSAIFVKCDVSSESEISALVASAVKWGGRLDIMVNNAGIAVEAAYADRTSRRMHQMSAADFDKGFAINTRGVFLGCKYAISQFLDQKPHPPNSRGDETRGWIVNTASMLGLVAFPNIPSYVTTKHAVIGLTKQIAIDYAVDRIHCNALCPGFVQTALVKQNVATDEDGEAQLASLHPWKALGKVEDVANGAVFLASDDSAWITGHSLVIDGGYTAQ